MSDTSAAPQFPITTALEFRLLGFQRGVIVVRSDQLGLPA